ncbi:hypothetical protein SAMN05660690_0938 [Geodermatophilus telluris]|uniref:PEP-CTERM protein-sorting domain-containing protein n=1 Tax=Geodermatophilus telluris TaxID=1190417 RepID=A0A1G6JRE3_9ACTN|nr:hypothetical protein [Geodermatophilus telluris]SDC21228.1 hypothetical protein SAMN05660690_0938 [Geodermatophilus telluris]
MLVVADEPPPITYPFPPLDELLVVLGVFALVWVVWFLIQDR